MLANGDSPSLADVRALLERDGKRPVLLYIEKGQKRPPNKNWQETTYEETQESYYQNYLEKFPNTGVLLGGPDNLCSIDCDTELFMAAFIEINPCFASTLISVAERAGQFWGYITGARPHKIEYLKVRKESPLAIGAKKIEADGTVKVGEFRGEGGQSVIRGIHPHGMPYRWACSGPPIVLDFTEINWPPDVIIPWGKDRRSTQSTTGNKDDDGLLKRAIDALPIDKLWAHFNYPARSGNPVCSPFRNDRTPSFSIYDEGRRFKDHGTGAHGDSFDFFQLATGQDAKGVFEEFVKLAGLGDELRKQPKRAKSTAKTDEEPDDQSNGLPAIMHPQRTYISEFAFELGAILKVNGFYQFHGRAVQIREVKIKARNGVEHEIKKLVEISTIQFSTLIENFCRPLALSETGKIKKKSISVEIAARTLVCTAFLDQLPEIKLWTDVRIPIRVKEAIILSQLGYDPLSGVYTSMDAPIVDEALSLDEADQAWRKLMAEFCFPKSKKTEQEEPDPKKRESERERCIAVALAAALTPLCLYLLPEKAKRPGFAASANSEGAGKTLLLSFGMVAKLGYVPTGNAPNDEDEMRKVLDSAAHNAVPIIFFDNLKGHLNSGELEGFITSAIRRYRMLGTTNHTEGDNLSTVYITANFATYSSDLRRRLLAIELILDEARAEERVIQNYLDEDALIKIRPKLLSIFWAFIRYWHENGEYRPAKPLPSFEAWTHCVAGIVEAAGYASPCQLVSMKTGGDTDTRDMEALVGEMNIGGEYRFSDLVELARDHNLFSRLIPEEGDLDPTKSTRLGILLRKFIGRVFTVHEIVDDKTTIEYLRFCLSAGSQKTRRFYVEKP
jgi:hypothetical protein